MKNGKKRVSKKDTYLELRKTFYECRNFEINNLWQKSVLLTAFIVLTFTVYVSIISRIFDVSNPINKIVIHEICSSIALVGFVFAIIWIKMGKGSKAWYEVYEHAICEIEREQEIDIPEKYAMGRSATYSYPDANIFTSKGGKYSPSKLNILIGRVIMFVWVIIFISHTINIFFLINKEILNNNCPVPYVILEVLLFISFIIIFITAVCNVWAKSSFFD